MADTTTPMADLNRLLEGVSLAAAARLARAGHYQAAESLLAQRAGVTPQGPDWLDLKARIAAQQGRLTEAEALWRQATEADPTHSVYRAGLQSLERLRRPWVAWALLGRPMMAPALALLGAVTLATATLELSGWGSPRGPSPSGETASASPLLTPPVANDSTHAAWRIRAPGVTTRILGPELVLSFEGGTFSEGARLTAAGKHRLTVVGSQLEPYLPWLRVRVVGKTDDLAPDKTSRYADNPALAMARAMAAIEHLRATTGLPMAIFLAQAGTENKTPDGPSPDAPRRFARTVELRISSRSEPTSAE